MGKVVRAVVGVVATVVGVVTGQWWLVAAGASLVMASVMAVKTPKVTTNTATEQRLTKRLEPEAFRKIVFGRTACAADLRYWEVYGTKANEYDEVHAAASHRISGFGPLYINDELAIPTGAFDGIGKYAGVLTRHTSTEGISGTAITTVGSGLLYTSTASMTGCAHFRLRFVYSQEKWPQGIPSRYTQWVDGAPVYDPRRDIRFGGTHDINDQDTWEYTPLDSNGQPIGRNNALQMLWYQIGWKINGIRVLGKGVDPADIDLDSFIQAANDCELMEWYSDCILSMGDSHDTNEGILEAAAQGFLLDTGGRYSYVVAVDDTANIAVELDHNDIIGDGFDWQPRDPMSTFFNEVAGTYIDPQALFQPRPFPMVFDNAYYTEDGKRERTTVALGAVQSPSQAQKLMRVKLNRSRLQGEFTATFTYKAMKAQNWSVIKLKMPELGWMTPRLFRVISFGLSAMGGIDLVLREESSSVYTGGTVVTPPAPGTGTGNDPFYKIPVEDLTAEAVSIEGSNGSIYDGIQLKYGEPHPLTVRTEVMHRVSSEEEFEEYAALEEGDPFPPDPEDAQWTTGTLPKDRTDPVIQPLQPQTFYIVRVRHISVYGVPGDWAVALAETGNTTVIITDNVFYPGDLVRPRVPVTTLRPNEPGADVTGNNTSRDTLRVGGKLAGEILAEIAVVTALGEGIAGDVAARIIETVEGLEGAAEAIFRQAADLERRRAYTESLGMMDGVPVGAFALRRTNKLEDDLQIVAEDISMIGARNEDSSAFVLRGDLVLIQMDEEGETILTLAQNFENIYVETDEIKATATTDRFARIEGDNAEAVARSAQAIELENGYLAAVAAEAAARGTALGVEAYERGQIAIQLGELEGDLVTFMGSSATADNVITQTILLMGARNAGSSVFIFNENTTQVGARGTFASVLNALTAADANSNAQITNLFEISDDTAAVLLGLTTTVDGQTTSINLLLDISEEQEARVTLAINEAGRITGVDFNGTTGAIVFAANSFAVATTSGGSAYYPFAIESGKVILTGDVVVNGGLIASGTITTSRIAADNITIIDSVSMGTMTPGTGGNITILTYTLVLPMAAKVVVMSTARHSYTSPTTKAWNYGIYANGGFVTGSGGSGFGTDPISCSGATSLAAGTHTITVVWNGQDSIIRLADANLVVMAVFR